MRRLGFNNNAALRGGALLSTTNAVAMPMLLVLAAASPCCCREMEKNNGSCLGAENAKTAMVTSNFRCQVVPFDSSLVLKGRCFSVILAIIECGNDILSQMHVRLLQTRKKDVVGLVECFYFR